MTGPRSGEGLNTGLPFDAGLIMPSAEPLREAALRMLRGMISAMGSTELGHDAWQGMRFAYRSPIAQDLHDAFGPLMDTARALSDEVGGIAEALRELADVIGHLEGVRDQLAGQIDALEADIDNEAFSLERALAFAFDWRLVPGFNDEAWRISQEQERARATYDQAVRDCVARIDRVSGQHPDVAAEVGRELDADEADSLDLDDAAMTVLTVAGPGKIARWARRGAHGMKNEVSLQSVWNTVRDVVAGPQGNFGDASTGRIPHPAPAFLDTFGDAYRDAMVLADVDRDWTAWEDSFGPPPGNITQYKVLTAGDEGFPTREETMFSPGRTWEPNTAYVVYGQYDERNPYTGKVTRQIPTADVY